MPTTLTATYDDTKFMQHEKERMARLKNLVPVLTVIQQDMVTTTDMNFRREQTPDGIGWDKSERAKKQGGKTLQDKGILRASINTGKSNNLNKVLQNGVQIGTNLPYAAIHQYGGIIDKSAGTTTTYWKMSKSGEIKAGFTKKKKSNFAMTHLRRAYSFVIPQRQFLGLTQKKVDKYNKMISRYIVSGELK